MYSGDSGDLEQVLIGDSNLIYQVDNEVNNQYTV